MENPALTLGPAAQENGARRFRGSNWFVYSAGGILALAGINHVLDAFSGSQVYSLRDPIFGMSFHHLLPLLGTCELVVAWFCLFTNRKTLSLGLVIWLVINLMLLRLGFGIMGWHHPYTFIGGLADGLNLSPLAADGIVWAATLFLITGSGILLRTEFRTEKKSQTQTMPCPSCGGHIRFSIRNLGQKIPCPHCQTNITLRKPGLLKMACFFCKGHIAFPAHALGTKMPCPHCQKDITLLEPK